MADIDRPWKKDIGAAKTMIRSQNCSTGNYKTVIAGDIPNTYRIVRRVNEMTAQFWLDWYNNYVKDFYDKGLNKKYEDIKVGGKYNFGQLPSKVNWLVMTRNYRRDEEQRVYGYQQLELLNEKTK